MKGGGLILFVLITIVACSNTNNEQQNKKQDFNAWQTLSDTNFLVRWEKVTLKSIDSITPILIKEENYSKETINTIKEEIVNSKEERILIGRKSYGSHKWLSNKFSEYKNVLDTTACNSMYIIELTKEGEVTTTIDWLLLFLNEQCRLILTVTVEDSVVVRIENKSINKQELEKLIRENYPSAVMTNKCLDKGEGLPMANLYMSKFTENSTEVFPFPAFCSGFYQKFLSIMQE